jgi:hypothetical protein
LDLCPLGVCLLHVTFNCDLAIIIGGQQSSQILKQFNSFEYIIATPEKGCFSIHLILLILFLLGMQCCYSEYISADLAACVVNSDGVGFTSFVCGISCALVDRAFLHQTPQH